MNLPEEDEDETTGIRSCGGLGIEGIERAEEAAEVTGRKAMPMWKLKASGSGGRRRYFVVRTREAGGGVGAVGVVGEVTGQEDIIFMSSSATEEDWAGLLEEAIGGKRRGTGRLIGIWGGGNGKIR
ncbi:hypothetical protein F3Y22_tig00000340pilonHSYRG00744 [Hibiscus syriacus]|uniref:Uncharacterized protein n=1 Tax=Hibiscus syriacus TaxID=106335 RepID=A0A6A3D8R9_HIBSY|nr:hypothetical protein F3Y22_tig00000340pilonHSYRG00744 [Hibiscus syriacus]